MTRTVWLWDDPKRRLELVHVEAQRLRRMGAEWELRQKLAGFDTCWVCCQEIACVQGEWVAQQPCAGGMMHLPRKRGK